METEEQEGRRGAPLAEAPAGTPAPHVAVVAVVGRTNAGKSTLVNRLVGEKVAIVSPVEQTTRSVVRGVLTEPRGQLVFVDTPGLHRSRSALGTAMNKAARAAAGGADAVLLVCDASCAPRLEDGGWMRRLVRSRVPVVVFLNKSDAGSRARAFREEWAAADAERAERAAAAAEGGGKGREEPPAAEPVRPLWLAGSAATGEGVDALLDALFELAPAGPTLFDGDTLSDHPEKLAVADLVREPVFQLLRDELPHAVGVGVDSISREPGAPVRVHATIYVRRSGQKGILLGEKGRTLRTIRRRAEAALRAYWDVPEVSCELWIKVEPSWDENFFLLRRLGYA